MKNINVLLLTLLLCFSFYACKNDDSGDFLPPGADFSLTTVEPVAGQEILFYADPTEGSGDIVEWNWNFGDSISSTSKKRNPYFTFDRAGTYNVTLIVKNAGGSSSEVSKSIVVASAPKEFIANIVWSFSNNTVVTLQNEGSNTPVIGDDGTIYYVEGNAGAASKIVAITDKGDNVQLKWATSIGGQISNAPAMGPDGNIYITSWLIAKGISKLNAVDGNILWSNSTVAGVSNSTPAVDAQGNVYHGSRSNAKAGAFSWSTTGEKRFEIINKGAFYASPVISKDGNTVYYLNTDKGEIWAVNTADGSQKWSAPVGLGAGGPGPNLSIDGDGTIYFTTNLKVAAITDAGASGSVKWSTDVLGSANSGVVIGPKGDLYVGSKAALLSLNPTTGVINWAYNTSIAESVPAVDVNGNIYVGTTDGKMIVINPKGQLLKEFQLGDGGVNSPKITNDGTVYVEALDNFVIKLYKIAVKESGPANSPWSMKGQNVKNTSIAK